MTKVTRQVRLASLTWRLTLNPEGPDLDKDLQLQPAGSRGTTPAGMRLIRVINESRRPGDFSPESPPPAPNTTDRISHLS